MWLLSSFKYEQPSSSPDVAIAKTAKMPFSVLLSAAYTDLGNGEMGSAPGKSLESNL